MISLQIEVSIQESEIEYWCQQRDIDFEEYQDHLDQFVNDYYDLFADNVEVL